MTGGTGITTTNVIVAPTTSSLATAHALQTGTAIYQEFWVTSTLPNASTFANGDMMIMQLKTYDTGFVPDENQIVSSIDGIYLTTYSFPAIDWIICINKTGVGITTTPTSKVKIENLIWPRYVYEWTASAANRVYIRWIDSTTFLNTPMPPYHLAAWPNASVTVAGGTFTGALLNIDKKRRNEIDCTYTFSWIPEHDMPSGTKVTLTLPTHYNLKASYPRIKIITPNFEDHTTALPLTTTYTRNTVSISNVKEFQAGTRFYIIISGMRNPDFNGVLNGWEIQTQY
jgi:hypothetical protein